MNIEIDYNPTPSNCYFISVSLNNKEAVSFDYTGKGHRIIKQILVENKVFPKDKKVSGEWDALVFENSKFVKRYHVQWIDKEKRDWVNNEIWETAADLHVSEELKNKLLSFSRKISDNYEHEELVAKDVATLEQLLRSEIQKFLKAISDPNASGHPLA